MRSCQTCIDLRRTYAVASRRHVTLLRQQEQIVGVDIEPFMPLDLTIERASMACEFASAQIRRHLVMDHDERPAGEKVSYPKPGFSRLARVSASAATG